MDRELVQPMSEHIPPSEDELDAWSRQWRYPGDPFWRLLAEVRRLRAKLERLQDLIPAALIAEAEEAGLYERNATASRETE